MDNDLIVSQSIDINASLSKVWNGLTHPEIIKEYLFGTETVTDWKVGGKVLFRGEYKGQAYEDHGIVLENEFQKRITYSYWSSFTGTEDKPENYSRVTYTLQPVSGEVTRFTWTTQGFTSREGFEHSKNGMPGLLEKIRAVIEKSGS